MGQDTLAISLSLSLSLKGMNSSIVWISSDQFRKTQ